MSASTTIAAAMPEEKGPAFVVRTRFAPVASSMPRWIGLISKTGQRNLMLRTWRALTRGGINRMKPQNARPQAAKAKLDPKMESVIQVKLPMVRDFSTGGGHSAGDTLFETDERIPTKKWQGYPPANLNVVGKPMPPMPEVAIPRFLGKAQYATRVNLPNMLFTKILISRHPHAKVRSIDTSRAEGMPGVAYILTHKNGPTTYPLSEEVHFQG